MSLWEWLPALRGYPVGVSCLSWQSARPERMFPRYYCSIQSQSRPGPVVLCFWFGDLPKIIIIFLIFLHPGLGA